MMPNATNARAVARETKKQADLEFYDCELNRLYELFSEVCERTASEYRCEAARMIVVAAAVFDRDSKTIPSRAKHAVRLLKEAIFMLDPKVSA
ncbi:hypothetical protein DF122_05210 [Burkholderia pseudomallei]|uniref:hypothetical protein n=1 Tax=Burkholderia pseudomallei TaxID=28450 RepID=UPI000F4FB483|nr:hypothetical protein [Burkholderia pseudomallei]RPE23043.1 hypothetical protein DF127_05900 [Burkholderia pseudomallei]RPE24655.1 hypothetical protein DF068_04550 [Burkholderia pseudomallei]RQS99042.1 hypothetical protein DF125_03050 [Burkholderia pseudomallei]RQZ56051.1 hypothetical protein DF060_02975 [Burkholderia pseudomallei]RSK71206.1 hypothetical protein DF122_05210 [Burkholderia pseudomallei]